MTYRKLFSYYGGKSRCAGHYPSPRYDHIIEPFAGGASYSLLYYERQVTLFELDEITASMWAFITTPSALDEIHRCVPTSVQKGDRIIDIIPSDTPVGLMHILRSELNQGSIGAKGYRQVASSWGARDWHQVLPRLEYWVPKISHWTVIQGSYSQATNQIATWFIDPPYDNSAGAQYRTSKVNHKALGLWCRTRKGQVIACENAGALWLPFRNLVARSGSFTGRDSKAKASGIEAIWTND